MTWLIHDLRQSYHKNRNIPNQTKVSKIQIYVSKQICVTLVLKGYGAIAGKRLSHHMDVRKIAFTGSNTVGRLIMEASAASNCKRVTLEMGGKSPNIVFPDYDGEIYILRLQAYVRLSIYGSSSLRNTTPSTWLPSRSSLKNDCPMRLTTT